MVVTMRKFWGPKFPSFRTDDAVSFSGVTHVQAATDDHQHVIQLIHDIETDEILVMHLTPDEEPECILSVLA